MALSKRYLDSGEASGVSNYEVKGRVLCPDAALPVSTADDRPIPLDARDLPGASARQT